MVKGSGLAAVLLAGMLAVANVASAQRGDSSIAGVARDTSGGVLPGVTVEVSSPALIEKTRAATTDDGGQYRVIDLVPGTYTVTFSLGGFATVVREGIQLTSGFAANVNAELRVGAVAETITVSGASPVVDTRNIVQQQVMTRDVIDAVPSDKNWAHLASYVPGMQGLDTAVTSGSQRQHLQIHGGRSSDEYILVNGMSIGFAGTSGPSPLVYPDGSTEEINIATGTHTAEMETGGIRVSIVPRSGGNQYRGFLFGAFANDRLQANVLNDDLLSRGLLAADRMDYMSDINPAFGGPIVKDRLWFHGAYRNWRVVRRSTVFYDTDPQDWTYTPDRSRETVPQQNLQWVGTLNLTYQASTKNKINFNYANGKTCECELFMAAGTTDYEASMHTFYPYQLLQGTWTRPQSSRLLFEVGASAFIVDHDVRPQSSAVGPPALERATGQAFRSRLTGTAGGYNNPYTLVTWNNYTVQGSASYVTGAHHFKAGGVFNPKPENLYRYPISGEYDYQVNLLNGVPNQVVFNVLPLNAITNVFSAAAFAQDQWTIGRFTLQGGVRFDQVWVNYPGVTSPATRLLPARSYTEQNRVIDRKDLSPRLGLAWDVFGNGKTAVKVGLNRYVVSTNEEHNQAVSQHPAITTAAPATRNWTDSNNNFIPEGDALNPLLNGELGPSDNAAFGSSTSTLRLDPDWTKGWFQRMYQWETSVSVQHELRPGASVTAGYVRRSYGNLNVTANVAVTPADFNPYCVTAYSDSRLPGGGGQQICGLYDVTPSKVGAFSLLQTLAKNYGNMSEYFDGLDLGTSVRIASGGFLQGGVSIGRSITDNCDIVEDNPQLLGAGNPLGYCRREQPWLYDWKALGSWNLPADVQVAVGFQSRPGLASQFATTFGITANAIYSNAQIAPSLGRNLASGANGAVTINLAEPGSILADRVNQVDVRGSKSFRIGGGRNLKVLLDLYNLLNSGPATNLNGTYGTTGATFLVPTSTLQGRLLKFGAQLDF
jgi:hypothetical protein